MGPTGPTPKSALEETSKQTKAPSQQQQQQQLKSTNNVYLLKVVKDNLSNDYFRSMTPLCSCKRRNTSYKLLLA